MDREGAGRRAPPHRRDRESARHRRRARDPRARRQRGRRRDRRATRAGPGRAAVVGARRRRVRAGARGAHVASSTRTTAARPRRPPRSPSASSTRTARRSRSATSCRPVRRSACRGRCACSSSRTRGTAACAGRSSSRPRSRSRTRASRVSPRLAGAIAADAHLAKDPRAAQYFLDAAGRPLARGHAAAQPGVRGDAAHARARGRGRVLPRRRSRTTSSRRSRRHASRPGDLTLADLAGYRAIERTPLCAPYRRYRVCGFPPPSSGGDDRARDPRHARALRRRVDGRGLVLERAFPERGRTARVRRPQPLRRAIPAFVDVPDGHRRSGLPARALAPDPHDREPRARHRRRAALRAPATRKVAAADGRRGRAAVDVARVDRRRATATRCR